MEKGMRNERSNDTEASVLSLLNLADKGCEVEFDVKPFLLTLHGRIRDRLDPSLPYTLGVIRPIGAVSRRWIEIALGDEREANAETAFVDIAEIDLGKVTLVSKDKTVAEGSLVIVDKEIAIAIEKVKVKENRNDKYANTMS